MNLHLILVSSAIWCILTTKDILSSLLLHPYGILRLDFYRNHSHRRTRKHIYIVITSLYKRSPWSSQHIPFHYSVPQSCAVLSGVCLSIEKSKTSSNSESLFWFRFWKAALRSNYLWRLLPLLTENSLPTRTYWYSGVFIFSGRKWSVLKRFKDKFTVFQARAVIHNRGCDRC